uniref:Uncharacterized protein n=1 Tax=Fagus sylvatica TaxID=28930 RepID=A0A2N9HTD7_FAGSY
MASSSSDPDSLVIAACSRLLPPSGIRPHCCFSIGEMDLMPTLEEYAELLQLGNPFSEMPVIPIQGPRSNRVLEYLGLTSKLSSQGTLLQVSRTGGSFESTPSRSPLQTPHHFTRHTVRQTVDTVLLFTGNSHDWALYLLNLPLSEWSWRVTWGPAVWRPWTHCSLFDGVPLPGVWGCTGYYPSLALRQFGCLQYPPRLGDLSLVTFDYVPGDDMWRFLSRVGEHVGREGWSPSFAPRPTVRSGVSHPSVPPSFQVSAPTGQPGRVADLERELEEARAELAALHLARVSEREESADRVESMRSTLHHSNAALEISEGAKDHLEQALAETQGQLEAKQVERTRVQDELDSLRSYTQALVDPSTGHPHDIVALQRALDESEASLTTTRTSIGAMRVQISVLQGDNAGLPVVRALHEATQVVDSLGTAACTVLEGYDKGDPDPLHCLREILHGDLHTSWSLVSVSTFHVTTSSQ